MSKTYNEILKANKTYQDSFGEKSALPMPPGRKLAILTCMDARLDPAKFAGLTEGDAHVIRNAGGRASDDAIRSLIISNELLGTNVWLVIHHTECGMLTFTDEVMQEKLKERAEKNNASAELKSIDWLTFSKEKQSIVDDVEKIRNHPLIPNDVTVKGYLFHVKSGELEEVSNENVENKDC